MDFYACVASTVCEPIGLRILSYATHVSLDFALLPVSFEVAFIPALVARRI